VLALRSQCINALNLNPSESSPSSPNSSAVRAAKALALASLHVATRLSAPAFWSRSRESRVSALAASLSAAAALASAERGLIPAVAPVAPQRYVEQKHAMLVRKS
jgi:hypothetical protein